ncbi:MAG: SPOR domain-containing protein [Treponema sp.]|nr:SPOR domain-containing protein [Treponema sp.]
MTIKSFSSKIRKLLLALILISAGTAASADDFFVCLGSYKKIENAKNLSVRLEEAGVENFISEFSDGDVKLYRVLHKKSFQKISEARSFKSELLKDKSLGFKDLWVVKNPEVYIEPKPSVKEEPKTKIINKDIKVKININLERVEPEQPQEDSLKKEEPVPVQEPVIEEAVITEEPKAEEVPVIEEPAPVQEEAAPVTEQPAPVEEPAVIEIPAEKPREETVLPEEPEQTEDIPVQEPLPSEEPESAGEPVPLPVEKEPVQIEELPVVESEPVISSILLKEAPAAPEEPELIQEQEVPELAEAVSQPSEEEDELQMLAELSDDIPILDEDEEDVPEIARETSEPDFYEETVPVQNEIAYSENDTSFFLMV